MIFKNPDYYDSFVVIFSQTHAEEQRTRRNSNVLKMTSAIVLAFFVCWNPYVINALISFRVCSRVLQSTIPIVQTCTLICAPFLAARIACIAAIIAMLLRVPALVQYRGKFNCSQETHKCECSVILWQ